MVTYLKGQFLAQETSFWSQMNFIEEVPNMFTSEDNDRLGQPVTREKLTNILKECVKEKSMGLDGWGIELFIHFIDLMIPYLLEIVQESRIHRFISRAINATFIALIPKRVEPRTFAYYCPISLCNLVYKMISKLIASRLTAILLKHITEEQLVEKYKM